MAALYLHNAIFIPDGSEQQVGHPSPHSRTLSSGTLRTVATSLSQPTEPLLHDTPAYQDILSRQPSHPSRGHSDWEASLSFDGDPATLRERRGFWEQTVRRRLRILKVGQIVLESVLVIWAIYNTVRYFLAYSIYFSTAGETVSLVLGTLTALAFSFLACAGVLSVLETYLLFCHIPIRTLLIMGTAFRSLAAFFLIAPTFVNLALAIAWRTSDDPELSHRCGLDIDVVWSVTHSDCSPFPWGFALGAAIVRTIVTGLIVVAHYSFSSAYRATRRPSMKSRRHHRRHPRPRSVALNSLDGTTLTSPPMTLSSTLPVSLLVPTAGNSRMPRPTSWPPQNKPTSSRGTSRSASPSDAETSTSETADSVPAPAASTTPPHHPHLHPIQTTLPSASMSDRELQGFVDRFRSLVTQISRETEDALALTVPSGYSTDDSEDDIYTALPPRRLGYDEFGQPYPPDESVRILNTYVRRMPTIESLGSREMSPSIASSYSIQNSPSTSRPPTRTNTFNSEQLPTPCSRPSSLGRAGGLGSIIAEVSETAEPLELVEHSPREYYNPLSRKPTLGSMTGSSARTVSGNSASGSSSYHTATASSSSSAQNGSASGPPTPYSDAHSFSSTFPLPSGVPAPPAPALPSLRRHSMESCTGSL